MISKPGKPLLEFVVDFVRDTGVVGTTAAQYRYCIGQFEQWAGRTISTNDFTPELINGFIAAQAGKAPATIANKRKLLIRLWTIAWESGLASEPQLRRIRKVKIPRRSPVAWSQADVERLLQVCDGVAGFFTSTGIRRSLFWRGFVMAAWDTGLRLSDLLSLRLDQIECRPDGQHLVRVMMQKTGDEHVGYLSSATIDVINRSVPPVREFIFHWIPRVPPGKEPKTQGHDSFRRAFKRLASKAGLKGTPQMLRRASATAAEIQQPGSATYHLGHRNPNVAPDYYIDRQQVRETVAKPPTLPPPLDEGHQ